MLLASTSSCSCSQPALASKLPCSGAVWSLDWSLDTSAEPRGRKPCEAGKLQDIGFKTKFNDCVDPSLAGPKRFFPIPETP